VGRQATKQASWAAERDVQRLKDLARIAEANELHVKKLRVLRLEIENKGRARQFAEMFSLVETESSVGRFDRFKHIKEKRAESLEHCGASYIGGH
jgi:hypothetical protein